MKILPLLLAAAATPALALDYQVHGFAGQAFALSSGNDIFGNSTGGSTDFYELGVNGTVTLAPHLLGAAQYVLRHEGDADDARPRVDYAILDYQLSADPARTLGLRAGRVKNPIGLYNDTRDVVFTRPSVLLPQSIYFDTSGARTFLFSSDGAQLYGGLQLGDHELSLVAGRSRQSTASAEERRHLMQGAPLDADVEFGNFNFGRIEDEWSRYGLRGGFSVMDARMRLQPRPGPAPANGEFHFTQYVGSLRWSGERLSLTGEYGRLAISGQSNVFGRYDTSSDGFYAQADWRFTERWSAFLRYDALYADRSDRDGARFAATTGGNPHSRYALDWAAGTRWLPEAHWGLWAEVHSIEGTATVSPFDNPGGARADHWTLLLLMAAYRF